MKKVKFAALIVLGALVLALGACAAETTENNPPPAPSAGQPLYVDVTTGDVDWANIQIIIDGRKGLSANLHTPAGEDFPTHVPLVSVANALGADVSIAYSYPPQVTLEGLRGNIGFTVGTNEFSVGNQTVNLRHSSLLLDNDIYVPIPFFRDVFGMGQAMWMAGIVYLDTEATDDMR